MNPKIALNHSKAVGIKAVTRKTPTLVQIRALTIGVIKPGPNWLSVGPL